MKIATRPVDSTKFDSESKGVIILPENYLANDIGEHSYHSTTLSFYKYARNKIAISCLNTPDKLLEQRSGEWFAPVLLFTSQAIVENPHIVSITCGIIANYITDFFKGTKKPNIKLKVLYKKTKASTVTEIIYEGSVDGLTRISDTILDLSKGA